MKVYPIIPIFTFIMSPLFAQDIARGEKEYVTKNTISFEQPIEVTPVSDFQKLNFSDSIRVFGLGEANHGTKEFQVLKLKLAQHLIKEKELNTIILEFPYSHGLLLDSYVKGKDSTGLKILTDQKSSEYDNVDFIDFINTIKVVNETRNEEDKISFLGGDIFGKPTTIKLLMEYFDKVDPAMERIFTDYKTFISNTYLSVFQQDKKEFTHFSKIIRKLLKKNRYDYIEKSSEAEFNTAIRLAESLGIKWKGNKRAISFANNVLKTLSENPKNKVLVLAHNRHIGMLEVGNLLKDKLSDQYFAIGTDYVEGTFVLRNLKDPNNKFLDTLYTPVFENSFASKFSHLDGEFHYLSFVQARNLKLNWIKNKEYIASIGMGFNKDLSAEEFRQQVVLTKYFDAIFVFRKIHPIILN